MCVDVKAHLMHQRSLFHSVLNLVDHIQVLYCFDHCDHGGFDDHDHVCYIVLIIPIMTIMVVSTIINNNVLTCDHVCAIQDFHSVDHYDHDANDGFNDDHHNNVFKIQERANTVEWEVILSAINIFIILLIMIIMAYWHILVLIIY